MARISPEAESRLLDAIERSAELVTGGESPNAALAKAAQEHGVPAGHLDVMVHAYNTGRTNQQRQAGATVFEKAAEFDLADTEVVKGLLFPQGDKLAAERTASVVSDEYSRSPKQLVRRRAEMQKRAELAALPLPALVAEPPKPYARLDTAAMQAYDHVARQKRAYEEQRRLTSQAFDKLADAFLELTDYFRDPQRQSLKTAREHAGILLGEAAQLVIDQVVAVSPGLPSMPHHKRAESQDQSDGVLIGLLSQVLDHVDLYKQAQAAADTAATRCEQAADQALRPFSAAPSSVMSDDFPTPLTFEKSAMHPLMSGAAGGLGAGMAKNVIDTITNTMRPPDEDAAASAYDSLTDPNHEAGLRAIRSSAALQDLMLNDPVVSGYSPDDVTAAYNSIVELSPRAADQQMLLQSLLRSRLTKGQLDPFEVDQLLAMEDKLRKRDAPLENRSVLDHD